MTLAKLMSQLIESLFAFKGWCQSLVVATKDQLAHFCDDVGGRIHHLNQLLVGQLGKRRAFFDRSLQETSDFFAVVANSFQVVEHAQKRKGSMTGSSGKVSMNQRCQVLSDLVLQHVGQIFIPQDLLVLLLGDDAPGLKYCADLYQDACCDAGHAIDLPSCCLDRTSWSGAEGRF